MITRLELGVELEHLGLLLESERLFEDHFLVSEHTLYFIAFGFLSRNLGARPELLLCVVNVHTRHLLRFQPKASFSLQVGREKADQGFEVDFGRSGPLPLRLRLSRQSSLIDNCSG